MTGNILEGLLVGPERTVKAAIETLGRAGRKVALIVSEDKTLLGIFTDGDMRRYVLSGGDLFAPIASAMNKSPYVLRVGYSHEDLQHCFVEKNRFMCPVIDEKGHLVEAVFRSDYSDRLENFALPRLPRGVPTVIMAGGFGKRLYPYTKVWNNCKL